MKFALILLVAFSSNVFADQCQWNSKTDAASALKLVKENEIILWCQNCGQAKPSLITKVKSARLTTPNADFRVINIETAKGPDDIDLAYTYVRTATNIFTNIAHLVGCPSDGATTFIQTGPGVKKTAHFYNNEGVRVDVLTATQEVEISAASMKSERLPASKK